MLYRNLRNCIVHCFETMYNEITGGTRMKQKSPTAEKLAEIIKEEIEKGIFGEPGRQFLSTRHLGEKYSCSLVTAQKVMVRLREEGIITLSGKKYYMTHGKIGRKTPFAKVRGEAKKLIGFHVTNIESPFFAALVKEAERAASKRGYRLITASSRYHMHEETEILRTFCEVGAAGILSCPGTGEGTASLYKNYILPCVFLCRKPRNIRADVVLVDNYSAGKNVARHLCTEGYRSFAYIGFDNLQKGEDERFAGFCAGLAAVGYRLPESHVLRIDAEKPETAERSAKHFLRTFREPVAVFCFQDLLAVETFKACRSLKKSVPEEVAICGFDNLAVSEVTAKPLTTVGYPIRNMAEAAVDMLVRRMEGNEKAAEECAVTPSLFIRESTRKDAEKPVGPLIDYNVLYKI